MDPLTFRIVIVGVVVIALGLGSDILLTLTGHEGSAAGHVAINVVTAGVSILTIFLAGKSGIPPAPGVSAPKTILALLSSRPPPRSRRSPPPPPSAPPSAPPA